MNRRSSPAPAGWSAFAGVFARAAAPAIVLALSLAPAAMLISGCAPNTLLLPAPRTGDAWRMYGGGAGRTNASPARLSVPLARDWAYDAGSGFGPASVAVSDSTVFAGTLTGEVRAIDLSTGRETGSYDFGAAMFGTPVVSGARMFVGLSGEAENLVCYNLRTGKTEWTARTADIESSLLSSGGRIIAAGIDGSLSAFDTATGKEAWTYALPETRGRPGIRSSPSGDGKRVFAGTDAGEVIALDLGTGELLWKSAAGGAVFAPTSAGEDRVFACALDGTVSAFDAATGRGVWTFDAGAPLYGGAAIAPGMVVVGTSGGELICLSDADGTLLWRSRTVGGIGSAPLVCGAAAYVGDLQERLYAFDLATGAELWREEVGGRVRATPVAADGWLVVLAEDRKVIGFRGAR